MTEDSSDSHMQDKRRTGATAGMQRVSSALLKSDSIASENVQCRNDGGSATAGWGLTQFPELVCMVQESTLGPLMQGSCAG